MCALTAPKNKIKETAKLLQKKYRDETNLFLAEGNKILEEIIYNNIEIVEIFSLKELNLKKITAPVYITDEQTMKKISSTSTPCDVVTVVKKRQTDKEKFKILNNIILIDEISDPGNLGTIIRSAAAFGVEGIILYGNCVDIYSPKIIRSTAGNFYKIPVLHINNISELKETFKNHTIIATALSKHNNISLKECKNITKRIIMFGSEANGLNKDLLEISNKNIKLKMQNDVESLNLAVCASIIMYELFY